MQSTTPHVTPRRATAEVGASGLTLARILAGTLAFSLALTLALTGALEAAGDESASTVGASEIPPAGAGWRVYLDPETGEVTSTPSALQIQALSERLDAELEGAALHRSTVGLKAFELQRGGRGVFLEGRFQSALTARMVDGRVEIDCGDAGHDHGTAHSAHPPSTVPEAQPGSAEAGVQAPPVSKAVQWVER